MKTDAALLRSCYLTSPAASLKGEFSEGQCMIAPRVFCREGRSAKLSQQSRLLSVDKCGVPGDDAVAI
jgi:hypothetical protein